MAEITEIIEYVRDENRNPTGCFVAHKTNDGNVVIGWSGYNIKTESVSFSRAKARKIARGRIESGSDCHIPFRMIVSLPDFEDRCKTYFAVNDQQIIVVGDIKDNI